MSKERIFLSPPHMGGTELDYIHKAFDINFIAPIGPLLTEFEQKFCELTGFKHAVAVTSGTAAIHLGLRQLGVQSGDVVIASTLTFIGSVTSATFLGADLHFVDCDETWNMDPALLAQAIEEVQKSGRRVGAVLPTDLYGQCCDYDAIRAVCKQYDIPLLIDAAESVGASYKGKHAGCGGDAAIYSFNGNKIITTGGGGLLASDDKELIEQARWLSQQARDEAPHYEHSTIGYNYRMSSIAASIGLGQLEVLDDFVARLREIFAYYEQQLASLPGLTFMPEAEYGKTNRWLTVMLVDDAFGASLDDIAQAMAAENIETRPVWKPMHLQPVFKDKGCTGGAVSEDFFNRGICLPSGSALTEVELERVVNVIKSVVK